jgi:hypothetical protein
MEMRCRYGRQGLQLRSAALQVKCSLRPDNFTKLLN